MKLVIATMKYLAVSALLPKFLSPLTASVFGNNPPNAPCSIFFGTKNKKLMMERIFLIMQKLKIKVSHFN